MFQLKFMSSQIGGLDYMHATFFTLIGLVKSYGRRIFQLKNRQNKLKGKSIVCNLLVIKRRKS